MSERDAQNEGSESVGIVACGVFEDALRAFAAETTHDIELYFLDIEYHSDYDGMAEAIQKTVEDAREEGVDRVLVGYGSVCHPDVERIVEDVGADMLSTVNCIHALAGRETHAEVFRDNLLFVTPGWLEKLLPSAREAPERFATLDRIVFINPIGVDRAANDTSDTLVEERLEELAELTGLAVERRTGSRDTFDEVLEAALS